MKRYGMRVLAGLSLVAFVLLGRTEARAQANTMLTVHNGRGAVDVRATSAVLSGGMMCPSGTVAAVKICWGLKDGGRDLRLWQHVETLGERASGDFRVVASNLTANTQYYYRSWAGTATLSVWATNAAAFRTPAALEPPAHVMASDGLYTNMVVITWDAVSNATSYMVYRGESGVPDQAVALPFTSNREVSDFIVQSGRIYYYWVKAVNAAGSSRLSLPDTGFVGKPTQLPPLAVNNDLGAAEVRDTSAVLRGALNCPSGTVAAVKVCWGNTDGGSELSQWEHVEALGERKAGEFRIAVTNLVPNTQYVYRAWAGTGDLSVWAPKPAGFRTGEQFPVLHTLPATEVTTVSARLNGQWAIPGTVKVREIAFRWGAAENSTRTALTNKLSVGVPGPGLFSTVLTNLAPEKMYAFNCMWTDDQGRVGYAPEVLYVKTPALPPPPLAVGNGGGATNVTFQSALLRGILKCPEGTQAVVAVFWGPQDGGTSSSNWAHAVRLGERKAGPFDTAVTGLTARTTYFYRCFARNAAGDAWAEKPAMFVTPPEPGPAYPLRVWSRIWGGKGRDSQGVCAVDPRGNIYVAGRTQEPVDGVTNAVLGNIAFGNACLSKFTPDGTQLWTTVWGSAGDNSANAVAVDRSGCVYVAGMTCGALDGQAAVGRSDAFLCKFSPDGKQLWTKTWGSPGNDNAQAVDVDANGDLYVAGTLAGALADQKPTGMTDQYLMKLNAEGTSLWTRVWGSPLDDNAQCVRADKDGSVYVGGRTMGPIDEQRILCVAPGWNACLTRFDGDGKRLWTRIWGGPVKDSVTALAVDARGAVYAAGSFIQLFDGWRALGDSDAFVTKFLPDGKKEWTRVFGSPMPEQLLALAVDAAGNAYAAGFAGGRFPCEASNFMPPFPGGQDLFLAQLRPDGSVAWTRFWGALQAPDTACGVAIDPEGFVYVSGDTAGSFDDQPYAGGTDLCLSKWAAQEPRLRLVNGPVLELRPTAARVQGRVTTIFHGEPHVYMYWGLKDGGTDSGLWEHSEDVGTRGVGAFEVPLRNLKPDATYYYRCYGVSCRCLSGAAWAPESGKFHTPQGWPGDQPGAQEGTVLYVSPRGAQIKEGAMLPYEENFEKYEALSSIAGVHNWSAPSASNLVVVRMAYTNSSGRYPLVTRHTQVLQAVGAGAVLFQTNQYATAGDYRKDPARMTNVWIDCMIQPVLLREPPAIREDTQVALYFNAAGRLVIWHARYDQWNTGRRMWTELQNPAVKSGEWVRLTVKMDYLSARYAFEQYFQVRLNGGAPLVSPNGYGSPIPQKPVEGGSWHLCADSGSWQHRSDTLSGNDGFLSSIVINGRGRMDDLAVTAIAPLNLEPQGIAVVNGRPEELGPTTAVLTGELQTSSTTNAEVAVFWGLADGGTNFGAWEHAEDLNALPSGGFRAPIRDLTPETVYFYRCFASNSAGRAWANSTADFRTPALPKLPPQVNNNRGVTNSSPYSVWLNGDLVSAGGDPVADVYIGLAKWDCGAEVKAWPVVARLSACKPGPFTAQVPPRSILAGVTYYYRCWASNSVGIGMAPTTVSFLYKGGIVPPVVDNSKGAVEITATAASLQGTVSPDGGAMSVVRIGWGPADGGTNFDQWAFVETLEPRTWGPFSKRVEKLLPETEYFYRCYASNVTGTAWAPASARFVTRSVQTQVLVVNSAYGTPVPAGSNVVAYGERVTCTVGGSPVAVDDSTRIACRGWTGTSSGLQSGPGTNVAFAVTSDTTLTWLWNTQYLVEARAEAGGTTYGSGWYEAGAAQVYVKAASMRGFRFMGWTGDVTSTSNPLLLRMDRPCRLVARFSNLYRIVAKAGPNGSITPSGELWLPAFTNSPVYEIVADEGSHIRDVRVNGRSMGIFTPQSLKHSWSVNSVQCDYTIEAVFNRFPLCQVSATPTNGMAPMKVEFSIAGSSDADGKIVRWELDKEGDGVFDMKGGAADGIVVEYGRPGIFQPKVRVYDDCGAAATATAPDITVLGAPPTADLQVVPAEGPAPLTVRLDGSASAAGAGYRLVAYEWDLDGDGTFDRVSTTPAMEWIYRAPGTNTVVLQVRDNLGRTATAQSLVTVLPTRDPPLVSLSATPDSGVRPLSVVLSATVRDNGAVTNYLWDFDGDGQTDLATATQEITHVYENVGTFAASVTAVDNDGLSASARVSINVAEPEALRVWIVQPRDGQTVWGKAVSVNANAVPASKVTALQIQYRKAVEGGVWTNLGARIVPPPADFKAKWDVTGLEDKTAYELRAIAWDSATQQVDSAAIRVTVDSAAGRRSGGVVENNVNGKHEREETFEADGTAEVDVFDGTTVTVPLGAVEGSNVTVRVTLTGLNTNVVNGSAAGRECIGANRTVTIEGDPALERTVEIRIPYPDENQDGIVDGTQIRETTLTAHWYDPVERQWRRALSSEVLTEANVVCARTYHLTEFGLFGNRNLLLPANGGVLAAAADSAGEAFGGGNLADDNAVSFWRSAIGATGAQSFVYLFADDNSAVLDEVVLYNSGKATTGPDRYSQDFSIQTSIDGQTFRTVHSGTLAPRDGAQTFALNSVTCRVVRLAIRGVGTQAWELAEFELHGAVTNDVDGDGMKDAWEVAQFRDLLRDGRADFDNDRMPDRQEYLAGADPKRTDSDSDGQSDGEEWIAGTDPLDPTKRFHGRGLGAVFGLQDCVYFDAGAGSWVTGRMMRAQSVQLRWDSAPGRTYRVYGNADLTDSNGWKDLTGPIGGDGSEKVFEGGASDVNFGFYRIGVAQ